MRTRAQVKEWRAYSTDHQALKRAIDESLKLNQKAMNHSPTTPPKKRFRRLEVDPSATKIAIQPRKNGTSSKDVQDPVSICARTLEMSPSVIKEIVQPTIVLQRLTCPIRDSTRYLCGRQHEQQVIEQFLSRASTVATSLFVIGPPGTGKSSCVAQVANKWMRNSEKSESILIHLNCNAYPSPISLYNTIYDRIMDAIPNKERRRCPLPATFDPQAVHAFFHKAHTLPSITIILDEVDHLLELPVSLHLPIQQLLQFLIQWGNLPFSPFRFIGILNGMEMQSRIHDFLQDPVDTSQLLLFPSYTYPELIHILEMYVINSGYKEKDMDPHNQMYSEIVESRALELIARKMAAREGDARQAIGLLQQCAQMCLQEHRQKLTVRDVLVCASRVLSSHSNLIKQIQQLPRQPKILLYAIIRLASGIQYTDLEAVLIKLANLQLQSELVWIPQFRQSEVHSLLDLLDCYGLIKRQEQTKHWKKGTFIASTISMDILQKALEKDELLCLLPTK